jgi:hypothetical protein
MALFRFVHLTLPSTFLDLTLDLTLTEAVCSDALDHGIDRNTLWILTTVFHLVDEIGKRSIRSGTHIKFSGHFLGVMLQSRRRRGRCIVTISER